MEELIVPNAFVNADGLAHISDWHRVARRPDRRQGVIGNPALLHAFITIG
jgi:hypothetical protein